MSTLLLVCGVMLGVAAMCAVARMTMGPTLLDRALALDVFVSIALCAVGLQAAVTRQLHTLPILLVLTVLGFVGSVAVARFTRGSDDIEAERS